ncbi:hypothetical protein TVAG_457200 [Trichomonas vaginalis G3]|uniref:Uncharacterized protein n=1 Tax=Trichomonas vaginalis (strain ATCC PRA-98 / G3) TaxID=412133 RepID=A2DC44_TRIV3|nr:hypothetical protein TVAGG3_0263250 [Trichomonas vaginalis G3]EAY22085.1 hypothetical protein TVAG_457200 [Trichomonas vaginalis G3]KAI5525272.1 hypothetical protein TVAGG3_0263250 [Trichomonas vaginalis G3]|eukprot:XP_001583071.1 hypothetical protein [Trichomonas vaginalis G3]
MINDDDFYFDFDAISSPIAAPNEALPTSMELSYPSFFEDTNQGENVLPLEGMDTWMDKKRKEPIGRSYSTPEIQNVFPIINEIKSFNQRSPITQKPQKKQPIVFQPFSSFDAAEITVKALKEHVYTSKSTDLFKW